MNREFTATAFIIEEKRVLLIYHLKLGKWLPPGGHIDPHELPTEAVKREVREETGLEVEIISQENIWIQRWNAKSFERPFMCLLEEIPEHNGKPAHQHMDLIYLARPVGGELRVNHRETEGIRWFSLEEIEELEPDQQIYEETKQTLRTLLERFS